VCPVFTHSACKRRPRGSLSGGRADGSQIWFCFSRDQRWRPSWFADAARGHGRASRGEKCQRSSGHRSESVLPIRRLISPDPLEEAPRGAPLCQNEDPRGPSGPVGGLPPSPAACGPDGGEGDAWFAPGRRMARCRVRATTHHPCMWAAGRRAAAVGSAKGYGDRRRTPRLVTVERLR
jgi:hypothetical protein